MKKLSSSKMVFIVLVLLTATAVSLSAQTLATDANFYGTTLKSKSPAEKSATGLSSLPPDAQGPISAALGKDDSGCWLHADAEGFRAENPRHALVAEFTRAGAEVRRHNLRWALTTRAYGYGGALHPLKAVAPQANANRVEYRRDGVTEWYENGPLGLEQGFTLAHPPGKARPGKAPAKENGQPLTIELALRGDLTAAIEAAGLNKKSKSLELRGKDGKAALRYTGLKARDATGRELPSWLEVRGERLLVRVEDDGARYPLVVDPWIQQGELTASDGQTNVWFGYSVAVEGSTAVVGAPIHTFGQDDGAGAAYVFVERDGTWNQQQELTWSDAGLGDGKSRPEVYEYFGWSVAISGSTIVVGTRGLAISSVYVFVESGGTWSLQAELTAPDSAYGDYFGSSVAVSGTTVVVGARYHTVGSATQAGAAYVFGESGGTWSLQAELTASDGVAYDGFGWSVGVNGSTVVVGAPAHPACGEECYGPGAAYVFVESGGTWTQQAELTASDGVAGDQFGGSVGVSGSTALVGAEGAAYVFAESGGTWTQQAELTASDGAVGDYFGSSVALDGNTAVVSADDHSFGTNYYQGAAYVFVENGATWTQQQELAGGDGTAYDEFGYSVAIGGGTVAVGAFCHPGSRSGCGPGAAYVFSSSGPLFTLSASPDSLIVPQGGQGTSTITITPWNGFSGSVSLSVPSLPNGVTAQFTPNPDTSTSTLTLTADATAVTGTVTLLVTGTSGNLAQTTTLTLTLTPAVTVSPASLSFGNVAVGSTSPAQPVWLSNIGTAMLYINSIVTTGDFAILTNKCDGGLPGGRKCKVTVNFTPTQLGPRTGTLIFTDNGFGSPQTVTLSGTGTVDATLAPSSADYGNQKVGTTSQAKKFTLTNNQLVTLTNIATATTGDFAVSATTCRTSLAKKARCTISVTFTPTQTGARTGQLSVSDSANNSPQTASLTGTGT